MLTRTKTALFTFSVALALIIPSVTNAQSHNGALDPVYISKTYYNSIVKILLYDSAAPKKNADLAYIGRGSGFFVSEDGYIFTNRHVIDYCGGYCRYTTFNADEKKEEENMDIYSPSLINDKSVIKINYIGKAAVIVQVYNNASGSSYNLYYAKVLVTDTSNFDGAILKIVSDLKGNPVTEKFHPVPLGNSDSVQQGQDLCLYGFPAQINGSFNVMLSDLSTLIFGKHSGLDYNINTQYGLIKTDAVINSGNSGGPVFGLSNNVIGIATAAFNKTNIGLIGGIDAMNDLVALIPDLKNKLVLQGFAPQQHRPATSTAAAYKPNRIPSKMALEKINGAYSGNKASNSFNLSIGFSYGIPHNETHTISDFQGTVSGTSILSTNTNGGASDNIPTMGYGGTLIFGSPSIIKNSKHLLCGFIKLGVYENNMDWSVPDLYTVPHYPTTFQMYSSVKALSVTLNINLNYSYALDNGLILGVYCGIGYDLGDVNDIPIGLATSNGQTAPITYNSTTLALPITFGVNAKYKCFFADLEDAFYTEKINYILPYFYDKSISLFYSDYFVPGIVKRNPIFLTLGYSYYFYGKKR